MYNFKKIIDKSIIINYNRHKMLTFISYKRGYYMGNFFTSIQIHNPDQLSREQFIELFCNKMKENGFVIGNADDHEISYALSFADDCKWVAIGSESYEQGNEIAQKDVKTIAKMLNTLCINVTVVDSDFAMLDMYSNAGRKLDTAVIGRADDYLGDEITVPKKNAWSPLLSEDSTWERFITIQQGNYIFVEDGLAELAPLLGMDSRDILFNAKNASESDDNTCFLYFKKASTKKPKKLTLNAAFKQVFGEALEPLGFVKIKSKHPYYVRVVNGEILHIITYRTEQAQYPEDKAFNVLGGIATVYRRKIDLNVGIQRNYNWLRNSISTFYVLSNKENYDKNYLSKISNFYYFSTIEASLINAMNESKILTEKHILPVFNEINTLEKCIDFFHKYKLPFSTCDYRKNIDFNNCDQDDEGYLYIQADFEKKKNRLKEILSDPNIDDVKRKRTEEIYSFFIETDVRNAALAELDKRKQANVELLKSYGLNMESPQKPKKLTLNADFKQVFGEALEPLGFKKVKSKYPYYARLVNDEILQVITVVSRPDKRFEILGGIATVYRQSLSLDLNPKMNESWLIGNFYYYRNMEIPNNERKYSLNEIYEFYGGDWLEKEMKRALDATKDIMLNIFDNIVSLEKCVDFYNIFGMDIRIHHKEDFGNSYPINYYNEGLLIIKTINLEQYGSLMDKYNEITINRRKEQITNGGIPYERLMNEQEVFKNKKISEYKELLDDKEWLATVDIELNNRRNHNIKLLKEYGLI